MTDYLAKRKPTHVHVVCSFPVRVPVSLLGLTAQPTQGELRAAAELYALRACKSLVRVDHRQDFDTKATDIEYG